MKNFYFTNKYIQYGYIGTISIESVDIPDKLIYHLNTITSYIKNKPPKFYRYILTTYATGYENIISQYIDSHNNSETIHVSTDCKIDTQCFSNKCINNSCTYNAEANVIQEYMNCGRMIGESCSKDTDCSCFNNHYEPSEIDALDLGLQKLC
ncbi:hypothetical protein PIROE2DRAFT_17225 [Piromyces sp. E2]|nr:hypothetical protein PIROE2DRAFT_17225 [Piromyces sp. E2]|eukprot:OUM57699.1 hypothetical protein PIROE2DRAFT_17225 [Piromyces sp. E2]